MPTLLLLLASLLLGSCASVRQQSCPAPDPLARASVVPLRTSVGGHGSGIIVGDDMVLTAAHVMGDEYAAVVGIAGAMEHGFAIAIDRVNDLALLNVPTGGQPSIHIADTEPLSREPVWALGFPRATSQRASGGHFKQVRDGKLYSTAEIDNGDSGGGLLQCDQGGYVLAGMIRSYAAYRENGRLVKVRDLSISVPAADIRAFVNAHAI
jgi:hypothetical protein